MNPVLIASAALAGLAIGWGQRAVIVRYESRGGDAGRRCCPACGQQAAAGRWLAQLPGPAGRCSACGARNGPPAAVVEATMAVLLGLLAARIHPGFVLAAACWLALCAVPLGFIDAATRRLPNVLTAAAYAGVAAFLVLAAAASSRWDDLLRAGIGGLALAGFYVLLVFAARAGMGMGDAKTAASTGTLLAWSSWASLVAGALAGFLLAALYGVILLARHRGGSRIAFGPFILGGAILVILAAPL
jgi:leader peptidase (prepilin peptidase) / N-methyltransferase